MKKAPAIVIGLVGLVACGGKVVDDPGDLSGGEHFGRYLERGGRVQLRQLGVDQVQTLSAGFWNAPLSRTITEWRDGPCEGWTSGTERVVPVATSSVDAGEVRAIGDGQSLLTTLQASDDGQLRYSPAVAGSRVWTAGAPVEVRITGSSDIPGFTRTLTVPPAITVASPAWDVAPNKSRRLVVSPTRDLDVVWRGGNSGHEVVVRLRTATVDDSLVNRFVAECRFPGGDGSGRVPRTVLVALRDSRDAIRRSAYADGVGLDVAIDSEVQRSADRNGFVVKVQATTPAFMEDGVTGWAGGQIELR